MLLTFWQENRRFFDEHYGVSATTLSDGVVSARDKNSHHQMKNEQLSDGPESLYELILPERAVKTDKYIIVEFYGTPPKDRWFDLRKLTSCAQDEQTKLWTVTAPRRQFEARGVIEDARLADVKKLAKADIGTVELGSSEFKFAKR